MKSTILAIIFSLILIVGAVTLSSQDGGEGQPVNNVSVSGDKQIIEINAKGGYLPRRSVAKSGVPTVLRMNTSGTFDCSIAVRIPSMGISKNLPPTASTDIDLGTPGPGLLRGTCAMGMYPFEIDFQS